MKTKTLLIGINSKYIHPAMAIFSLYTNSNKELDFIEYNIKDQKKEIIQYLNQNDYNVLAFSCYIWNIEMIKDIINNIKNKIIILGGPEASYNPNLLLTNNVNYIIHGEGEISLNELLDFLENKKQIQEVSNLYYLINNIITYTYTSLPDLQYIKHDLSLIKDFKNRICYLESSRGCFYNCTYCLASTEKPVRYFPIKEVKDNLLYLLQNKAHTIKFLDRSFNVNPNYALEILKFIKENDNGISVFQFEANGDNLNNQIINILNSMRKKMIRLEIGIQSTNQLTNKAIKRNQDFEKLKNNIHQIRQNVIIHTDLIAGLPYENYQSFKESFNSTFLLFTEELQLGFLKELKGTVISNTKNKYGYFFQDTAPFEVIKNNYITSEELQEIKFVEKGVDKFYNYGYFQKTMIYLFQILKLNPFDTFHDIVKELTKEKDLSSYQFSELIKAFYQVTSNFVSNKDELLFIIKQDYLTKTKIKPHLWWTNPITRPQRKEIYEQVVKENNLNIDELYKYAHLEIYQNYYFLINYKNGLIYTNYYLQNNS